MKLHNIGVIYYDWDESSILGHKDSHDHWLPPIHLYRNLSSGWLKLYFLQDVAEIRNKFYKNS